MFSHKTSHRLADIRRVVTEVTGGVHERLDENRALLELLQNAAPDFLLDHPWIETWIRSQDEFLIELQKATGVSAASQSNFPRPWPQYDYQAKQN